MWRPCYLLLLVLYLSSANQKGYRYDLRNITSREDFGKMLNERKFTTGAELGVQKGLFSKIILESWTSCTKYYLIDSWRHTDGYSDTANVDDQSQLHLLDSAKKLLSPWAQKTIFLRNYTNDAASLIPDNSLDFVYVDARHDYCGVLEDVIRWWPKLKEKGIMAGHDYLTGYQQLKLRGSYSDKDDWTICYDGKTINEGAVRGAVDEYAKNNSLLVFQTKKDTYNSWIYTPKKRRDV